jgi:hypothetical protein
MDIPKTVAENLLILFYPVDTTCEPNTPVPVTQPVQPGREQLSNSHSVGEAMT